MKTVMIGLLSLSATQAFAVPCQMELDQVRKELGGLQVRDSQDFQALISLSQTARSKAASLQSLNKPDLSDMFVIVDSFSRIASRIDDMDYLNTRQDVRRKIEAAVEAYRSCVETR